MTTPPPPPPGQPDWSATQPSSGASAGTPPREKWWTGGRIVVAIIVVLLLMGGAGFAGFVAGVAVGGTSSIIDDFEQLDELGDDGIGGGDSSDEGGSSDSGGSDTPPPSAQGTTLTVGDTITGTLSGDEEIGHELVVDTAGSVTIELQSDDFDTTVAVLDEGGEELAFNDDIDFPDDRNSRVQVELAPGTYTIVVGEFGFDGGEYQLTVS